MSTSKKPAFTEEEINKSFEEAKKKGEVTDLIGNKISDADLQDWDVEEGTKIDCEQGLKILKGVQGKVLTIIDAVIDNDRKRKYTKDLIKEAISSQADWLFELTHIVSNKNVIKKKQ